MMTEEYRMLSIEQAREVILSYVHPLETESVPIMRALGRTVAEDIYADYDIPPLSNSAMDGYAIRAADVEKAGVGSNAVTLRIIHDLAAGYTTDKVVEPGTAIRIMTGAPIPAGADTVVPFEETERQGEWVKVLRVIGVDQNIRHAGEDVRTGQRVLEAGSAIRAQEVGMLAALGCPEVLTHRPPRVGILATGDEVIEIDEPLTPGKIRNSNSYSNAAQVLRYGGVPVLLGIGRDRVEDITARIRSGLDQGIDLLLTSGGISVGDFDMVKEVLSTEGEMSFWRVRMRPGKPFAFGQIRGVPLLGLPGNPVSVMVSFEMFARPAILKMLGRTDLTKMTVPATLLDDAKGKKGFRYFLRASLEQRDGQIYARLTGEQGSGILLSMVKAQGLVIVPEDRDGIKAGETAQVMLL
jgi:molybdopterin molybdotransferase